MNKRNINIINEITFSHIKLARDFLNMRKICSLQHDQSMYYLVVHFWVVFGNMP